MALKICSYCNQPIPRTVINKKTDKPYKCCAKCRAMFKRERVVWQGVGRPMGRLNDDGPRRKNTPLDDVDTGDNYVKWRTQNAEGY